MIQPIETEYNGYRFRSRLEARWAVFFDAARIKYQYEPEGFKAEDGTQYLPDFYLPDSDIWCEVKPNRPGAQKEIDKALSFIKWGGPIKGIIVLSDIPNEMKGWYIFFPFYYYDPVSCIGNLKCINCCYVTFKHNYSNNTNYITKIEKDIEKPLKYDKKTRKYTYKMDAVEEPTSDLSLLHRSLIIGNDISGICPHIKKARQARFEHGEKPNKESNNE